MADGIALIGLMVQAVQWWRGRRDSQVVFRRTINWTSVFLLSANPTLFTNWFGWKGSMVFGVVAGINKIPRPSIVFVVVIHSRPSKRPDIKYKH